MSLQDQNFTNVFHILFYGPPGSGKTSNIRALYDVVPEEKRSEWSQWDEDSMVSFSCQNFPQEETRFQLYSLEKPLDEVPNLNLILSEINGVVFIADSLEKKEEENLQAIEELQKILEEYSTSVQDISWLIQYNKRDEEGVLPVAELEEKINSQGYPYVETSVTDGDSLLAAFRQIAQEMRDMAQQIENRLDPELYPESSSIEIQAVFDPDSKDTISEEEAVERLKNDGVLSDVAVERLDLSTQTFDRPLTIQKCRIGEFYSLAATFQKTLEIRDTHFQLVAKFSGPDQVTHFEGDLVMSRVEILADASLRGAVIHGSARLLSLGIKNGSLSLQQTLIHGKLELTDSIIKKANFRNLTVEGAVRMDPTYFLGPANFQKARLRSSCVFTGSTFEGSARFRNVHFGGLTDFSGADFQDEAQFIDSDFEGPTEFLKTCFGGPSNFQRVDFLDRAKFSRIRFETESIWTGMRCTKPLLFEECEFVQTSNFQKCIFSRVEFHYLKFQGDADFDSSIFQEPTTFHDVTFQGDVYFANAQFLQRADLKGAHFEQGLSIVGLESNLFAIHRHQVTGRLLSELAGHWPDAAAEYKILQKIFEDTHSLDDVDWAYYHHRTARRRCLSWSNPLTAFLRAVEWLVLEKGSGYGTRPFSILLSSIGVMVFFALLYFFAFGNSFYSPYEKGLELDIWSSVALSVSTFTTTGFTGWLAKPYSPAQMFLALEAFIGFFAMILFAATFIRKIMR